MRKYRFAFDGWGLVLFLAIMLPNLLWMAIPAPSDPLRAESITPTLDMIASACQVVMVATLCLLKNKTSQKIRWKNPLIIASITALFLYFLMWILYYAGIANASVILGLCLLPCMVSLFYILDRRRFPVLLPLVGFTVCHLLYGVINFIA